MAIDDLRLDSDRRLATGLLVLVLIPAVWFTAATARATLETAGAFTRALPTAATVLVVSMGLWFVAHSRTRAQYSATVFVGSLAVIPLLLAVAYLQPRGWFYEPSAVFLPLIAMGAMPNRVGRQILPPVLLTAALLAGRGIWFPGVSEDAVGDTLILTVVNAIGTVMVLRRAALQRMVSVAFEELHTLRGIIPICAYCKKVRSEAEGWQQIEKYVSDHSDANFSHGICPACIKSNYPDDPDLADADAER